MRGVSASARVLMEGQLYLLPEQRWRSSSASTTAARTRWVTGPTLRMSEQGTGLRHAVASAVTRDVTR
jgi:hypothetical protein